MEKIALFTTVNSNYIPFAKRCFELFEKSNPGVFDFYIITSECTELNSSNINVITLNPKDYIDSNPAWGWPPESFLYYAAPGIFNEKGYKYSMYVDADCVCLKGLDFTWLDDDFVVAGSPRMRNNLSEEIDAWYFLNAVRDKETINFLENTFGLENKNNIIDINSGVLVFSNQRWVTEDLYNKAFNLFNVCKSHGHPMTDDDSLLGLLILDTPKSFYKYLSTSWNWYYERPDAESNGGDNVNILHAAWLKPWAIAKNNINKNLIKMQDIWNNRQKIIIK